MEAYEKQQHWKNESLKKIDEKSRRLEEKAAADCTFAPQSYYKRAYYKSHVDQKLVQGPVVAEDTESNNNNDHHHYNPQYQQHRNEVKTDAFNHHIARQKQARTYMEKARKRNTTVISKNFETVTKTLPFKLSSSNRPSTEKLETAAAEVLSPEKASPTKTSKQLIQELVNGNAERRATAALAATKIESDGVDLPEIRHWASERAALISIIEAQRVEIKNRERGQIEAARVAKQFAAAVLAFEDRLVALEEEKNNDMKDIRKQLASQRRTNEKILQAIKASSTNNAKK